MKLFNDISSRNELADFLKISRQLLAYTLYKKKEEDLYTSYEVPKTNGGFRTIDAPIDPLKSIQNKLFIELTKYIQFIAEKDSINTNIAHGFVPRRSIITNAEIHRNKQYVLNFDIKDYFPSFHFGRVKGFFEKNKYFKLPSEVAIVIAQLTCYRGSLPQGAPTSPIIANLISNIFDYRILKLAKKYKLDYTRYADDLTFSTNKQNFLNYYDTFVKDLDIKMRKAGFQINNDKTRLQYKDSRQVVTGLSVNKIINSKKEFRKNTRAMAHRLYNTGAFHLEDGSKGTTEQLEGRFSFINSIDWYNTVTKESKETEYFKKLSSREKEYRNFLYYKTFIANNNPLLVTEGKTDIKYLKAAIKGLHKDFPSLGDFNELNNFSYKVSFLNRFEYEDPIQHPGTIVKQNKLKNFFNIDSYGADTMKYIFNLYTGVHGYPNLNKFFIDKHNITPLNPVILFFDNEISQNYPLKKFLNHLNNSPNLIDPKKVHKDLSQKNYAHIISNLYVLTLPSIDDENTEIEDLLSVKDISNFKLSKRIPIDSKVTESLKSSLANYIFNNYQKIDFKKFESTLAILNRIIKTF